ncbi:MAG: VWA domain-containing protein [Acidobacteriia bacterium]|nr:VWA domain-containing protein [Terriglobia bacterium]
MRYFSGVASAAIFALVLLTGGCGSSPSTSKTPVFNKPNNPEAIRKLLKPAAEAPPQDGIAAAILIDTSGSMQDPVTGSDKKPHPKIQVAQKALLNLLQQFSTFAQKHADKKLLVGIYEFSFRRGQASCRQIVKLGPPDVAAAQSGIKSIVPEGSTPIGDAMIAAARDLEATGLSHRHILVITDGESNMGYLPGDVTRVITQEPDTARAAIYFIAFDIGAELFEPVKDAGGLVLAADSEQQLTDTLDFILTGKILVEQPPAPVRPPHPPTVIRK